MRNLHLLVVPLSFSLLGYLLVNVLLSYESGIEVQPEIVLQESSLRRPFTRRIVAVGDLHGDLSNALKVLTFSGVIDADSNWSGELDFFVQTGDIIDRGPDTISLFQLMDKLRAQASNVGGFVLSHLGNHEWMNIIGDWRYVYESELATFPSPSARQQILTTGWLGQTWLYNYTTASRLPYHPSLGEPNTPYPNERKDTPSDLSHSALSFVHGGISPNLRILTPYPSTINEHARSLLNKLVERQPQPPPHPPNPYPGLPPSTTREEGNVYDGEGPVWYRGWALGDEKDVCRWVEQVTKAIGVRRLIMGHTPDFEGIVARCESKKIIIIDTGISRAYGGVLSALDIRYTLKPVEKGHDIWIEREVVTAVYPDRREVMVDEQREVRIPVGLH